MFIFITMVVRTNTNPKPPGREVNDMKNPAKFLRGFELMTIEEQTQYRKILKMILIDDHRRANPTQDDVG